MDDKQWIGEIFYILILFYPNTALCSGMGELSASAATAGRDLELHAGLLSRGDVPTDAGELLIVYSMTPGAVHQGQCDKH